MNAGMEWHIIGGFAVFLGFVLVIWLAVETGIARRKNKP